ncbi:ANK2 [Symbiodinium natans]|uniref:ANK2 protein n=1 Tax=Symbiodinium natans TaxID=878477 RepID=A0A812RH39_9DINO|nr:ANK2 [Symbiodinium natans]
MFRCADKDASGLLSFTEMSVILREGNPSLTDKELAMLFREIDTNGDLTVDFKEFARYLNSKSAAKLQKTKSREQVVAERCKEEFRKVDDNSDGKLSREELTALLRKGNPEIDQKELDFLFDTVDKDGNGQLDFDEFTDYITGAASMPITSRLLQEDVGPEPDLPSWSETVPVPKAYLQQSIIPAELRGVSREQLAELMALVVEVFDKCTVTNGTETLTLPGLDMFGLVAKFLKPITAKFRCSFGELVNREPNEPTWFISHFWGTPLLQTEEMLKQHAAQRKIRKQTPLWIDAFATCLHDPMQVFPSPKDLEQAPFCKVLLSPRCEGTLLLLDSTGAALERTWCLLEVTLTLDLPKDKGAFHAFDVAAWLPDEEKVAILQDTGSSFEDTQTAATFPVNLYIKGYKVAVNKSGASLEENTKRILHFLASTPADRWDKVKPPAECKGYSDVDARIQRRFVPGALAAAAMLDDEKTLRKILSEHGDFKESTTANGFRPMHVAAQKNCMTALKTLVAVKCDLDAPSKGGQTPLHVAAKEGSETAVQLLLKARADMNALAEGQTPLHASIEGAQITVTGTLLDFKADANMAPLGQYTPLQMAARTDQAAMCGLLLDFKADPLQTSPDGQELHQMAEPKSKLQETLKLAEDQAKAGLRRSRRPSVSEAKLVKDLSTICSESVKTGRAKSSRGE